MSLNAAYFVYKGRRIPSEEYAKFKIEVNKCLMLKNTALKAFFATFEPLEHEIHSSLTFFTPMLYTAENKINRKSFDVDNLHKPIADILFKTQDKVDDSAITQLSVKKFHGEQFKTILRLEIVNITR